MSNSPDFERLKQYCQLIERTVEKVDKKTLAEAARIQALNVAHCRGKIGNETIA